MSARTLQRWRQEGKGPAYLKLGGRVVYPLADVEAYERLQRRGGNNEEGGEDSDGSKSRLEAEPLR